MAAWATRIAFIVAMLLPIVVGLWLYAVVLAAPFGTLFPQAARTPEPTPIVLPTRSPATESSTGEVAPTPSARAAVAEATRPATAMPSSLQTAVPTVIPVPGADTGPVETVQAFYRHVSQGEFDAAAALWTADMRRRYPPDENIRQRFSQTWSIRLEDARLASVSQDGQQASVAVQIVEVQGAPPTPQRFVGTWWLLRGPNTWLMDRPALERG